MAKMKNVFLTKGTADCKIVVPDNMTIVEKTASEELVNYIEKTLSVKLPVVFENAAEGKCIYVGHTEYAKKEGVLGKSRENWIIAMRNGSLILTGGKDGGHRGILYATYHFLEEELGVRWWTPTEEDTLSLDEVCLPDDLYREGTPCFPYRKPLTTLNIGTEGFPFLARTRINVISKLDDGIMDTVYEPEVISHGGALTMGEPHHCHVMGKMFPASEFYDEHPDWWAWNEERGEHMRKAHYCFSNEGFFNAVVDKLLGYIKTDVERAENEGVELPYFYSLSLDDLDADYFFCHCPECKKVLESSGHSGYVIQFVNRVARKIKEIYPFAKFETLAYVIFAIPPKDDTVPDENVVIRLACDHSDMAHGFVPPANKAYLEKVKAWSDLCSRKGAELQIWQYVFNLQMNYPLPLVYGMQSFMQTYRDYGVKGLFMEIEKPGSDCHDLNVYVTTHLLENPDCDVEALVTDFANRYYGKNAGPYVKEYLDVLHDAMSRNVVHAFCCCEDSPFNYLDARAMIDGTAALDKAMSVVGDEKVYVERLCWLRKTFDGVMLSRYFDFKHQAEAMGEGFDYDRVAIKKRIVEACEMNDSTRKPYYSDRRHTPSEDEVDYYTNLPDKEEELDIPEFFNGIKPENIYQFPMGEITKMADKRLRRVFGFYPVTDEATTVSKVLKISYDECKGSQRDFIMTSTSRYAENPKSIKFRLMQKDETVEEISLYREDFVQGGYHIYKVGTVKNLKDNPDTCLIGYDYGFLSINIRGIASVFPMNECDVYLSMRAQGELYGGKANEENAIFVDRLIIVKKN